MYSFLSRYGQLIAFGLGLLLTVIYLASVFSGLGEFQQLPEQERFTTGIFDVGLISVLALIALCIIVALVFGLYYLIKHPANSVVFMIGLGALVVIFLISYSTVDPAASSAIADTIDEFDITETTSRLISGALMTTLIVGGLTVASFIVAEIANMFR